MNEKPWVSLICEYNPFHFGHLYQLKQLKSEFGGVVCIMSGNLVQRGSVAVADKYIRAAAALKSGADLVLELPIPWCCASAKDFAAAGVHIASAIGIEYLAFGAEDGIETLLGITDAISEASFSRELKNITETNKNISAPAAFKKLIGGILGEEYASAAEKPNNILAIEYLSSMKDKNIKPFVVKRNQDYLSSSSIRSFESGKLMLKQLPEESRAVFASALDKDFPRNIKKLDSFFIGTLRRMAYDKPSGELYAAPNDLINKLCTRALRVNTVEELISSCTDKIYTSARVRRAILAAVFGIKPERVHKMPAYTCVLAANETGRSILRSLKKTADIHIITKPARALDADEAVRESFLFAKYIEDIIALSAPLPIPADKGKTPTILNSF